MLKLSFSVLILYCVVDVTVFQLIDNNSIWYTPIKYYSDDSSFYSYLKKIFDSISSQTCLNFKSTDSQEIKDGEQGIYFRKDDKETSITTIGPKYNKGPEPNIIKILKSDLSRPSYIQMFIHMTLGAVPENNRCDRDKYIKMNWTNIQVGSKGHFKINNFTCPFLKDLGYDYGSLTHTGSYDFAKDKHFPTIHSLNADKFYQKMMGQRDHATFHDYKLLNFLLCPHTCSSFQNNCLHGGYLNPRNCYECKCPYGLQGKICNETVSTRNFYLFYYYQQKGVSLYATFNKNEYQISDKYNFYIYITANQGSQILITHVKSKTGPSQYPCLPKLGHEFRYQADKGSMGVCVCGEYEEEFSLLTEDNFAIIKYHGIGLVHSIKFYYQATTTSKPPAVRIGRG
uniref:Metalloendopeptidase n=1 Tax=Parastrongyloides trichosuri TaxID=131310 RepID=A0A0N5A6I9_PARTI